jgi:tetratricopeptide (TPR) repeat protein
MQISCSVITSAFDSVLLAKKSTPQYHRFVISKFGSGIFLFVFSFSGMAHACIWDAKTLSEEKHEHPTLAEAILHPKTEKPDVKSLTEEIQKLKAAPNTNDPMWWNNLAGSYLRLGKPDEAVKILEPLTNRFADDYGIHANLGTAYHLLGRYVEAEREIRRDTEINTNAHFGLEKYHLALLQYLSRDENYRFRHLYVDEFTLPFLAGPVYLRFRNAFTKDTYSSGGIYTNKSLAEEEIDIKRSLSTQPGHVLDSREKQWLLNLALHDEQPQYRMKWDLVKDAKLEDGVIYMATLNPKEPACWVMFGTLALYHRDYNLAKLAYDKAIQLGSAQVPILNEHLESIQRQLDHRRHESEIFIALGVAFAAPIVYYVFCKRREYRQRQASRWIQA